MALVYENDLLLRNPSGAVSPKINFGDEDTYVYESADDVLDIFVAGSIHTRFNASSLDHYLTLKIDHIGEHTAAHGTIIDNELSIVGTDKMTGFFYAGTTNPSNNTRLNYDGYIYVTRLQTPTIYGNSDLTIRSGSSIGYITIGGGTETIEVLRPIYCNGFYGYSGDIDIWGTPGGGGHGAGYDIMIQGGDGLSGNNGGKVFINGGDPGAGGAIGLIYLGDGSVGALPAKSSETNVVYYDPATGKLSYGTP